MANKILLLIQVCENGCGNPCKLQYTLHGARSSRMRPGGVLSVGECDALWMVSRLESRKDLGA